MRRYKFCFNSVYTSKRWLDIVSVVSTTCAVASTALLLIPSKTPNPDAARPAPVAPSVFAAPHYTVIDLGLPKGAEWVFGYAASPNFRYIVGSARVDKIRRAFVWHDGTFKYLSEDEAAAYAVTDKGRAVGTHFIDEDFWMWEAVSWNRNGARELLFSGDSTSSASEIDTRGTIFGTLLDKEARFVWRAYIRSADGSIKYLDNTPEQDSSFVDVNDKGNVLMTLCSRKSSNEKSVVWSKNKRRVLPPLPGSRRCEGDALNNSGDVVGTCWGKDHIPLPMVWKNNKPALIKIPGITSGHAAEINDRGDILGRAKTNDSSVERPFLIYRGTYYDLNALTNGKADIRYAWQMSSTGTILAAGFVGSEWHTFVLKPR